MLELVLIIENPFLVQISPFHFLKFYNFILYHSEPLFYHDNSKKINPTLNPILNT
jgi:hypothetical protein